MSTSTPPRHGDFATNIRATETAAEWLEGFSVDAALYAGANPKLPDVSYKLNRGRPKARIQRPTVGAA